LEHRRKRYRLQKANDSRREHPDAHRTWISEAHARGLGRFNNNGEWWWNWWCFRLDLGLQKVVERSATLVAEACVVGWLGAAGTRLDH
jgi:hypothetical protein